MRKDEWNIWDMVMCRLKFKTCKVLKVYSVGKEVIKILMGSVICLPLFIILCCL